MGTRLHITKDRLFLANSMFYNKVPLIILNDAGLQKKPNVYNLHDKFSIIKHFDDNHFN